MRDISTRSLYMVACLLILLLAAWLRMENLGDRPVHGDEANQALKTGRLLETGVYRYDPHEHHGPTLYFAAIPLLWAAGVQTIQDAAITQFRLLTAMAGMLIVALSLFLGRWLGRWGAVWAALFTAVSHGMVFYSQYYVQEMLLVLFALMFLYCSLRFLEAGGIKWALAAGVSAGLLHATKETCVLAFAAWGVALLLTARPQLLALLRGVHAPSTPTRPQALAAVGMAVFVSVLFFTSFFTWWRGPLDSVLTYGQYLHRAEGEGSAALHNKPFWYYFSLLSYTYREVGPRWTEAPVLLLALVGVLVALFARRHDADDVGGPLNVPRFLAVYGVCLALLLSLIPYKTPWNLLSFYQPLLLIAGYGASRLIALPGKPYLAVLPAVLCLLGAFLMARQAYAGTRVYNADARNPYVYAHPSTSVVRLVERVREIRAIAPPDQPFLIQVIKPDRDYWPLPWYFRDLDQIGYWERIPKISGAIVIADADLHPYLAPQVEGSYFVQMFSLRPNVLLHLYIRQELWDTFMANRQ